MIRILLQNVLLFNVNSGVSGLIIWVLLHYIFLFCSLGISPSPCAASWVLPDESWVVLGGNIDQESGLVGGGAEEVPASGHPSLQLSSWYCTYHTIINVTGVLP